MITKILAYLLLAVLVGGGLSFLWTIITASSAELEGGPRLVGAVFTFVFLYGAYAFAKSAGL